MCVNMSGRATRYANALRNRIAVSTTQDTITQEHRNPVFDGHRSQCEPGIDFDEVHRHVVCVLIACGHHVREHNGLVAAFGVEASADLP